MPLARILLDCLHTKQTVLVDFQVCLRTHLYLQAQDDVRLWSSPQGLYITTYTPHPLHAVVITLSVCGGDRDSGWEMCIGWAPFVPSLCSFKEAGSQQAKSLEPKGPRVVSGKWSLPVDLRVMCGSDC